MKFNRLNDLYFKRLLGDKNKKSLTLNFLNSILDRDANNYFTDITFLDKDNEPETIDEQIIQAGYSGGYERRYADRN